MPIMMQSDSVNYFNENNELIYYSVNDCLYAPTFPKQWAKNHLENTGPKNCGNCLYYGCWNGVFIGYCPNCAIYKYKGKRGLGIIDFGIEQTLEDVLNDENFIDCELDVKIISAFDSYLSNVDLNKIGDIKIFDSKKNKDEMDEYYKFTEELEEQSRLNDEICEREFRYYQEYGSEFNGGYDSY
jgi:hypothetical protein